MQFFGREYEIKRLHEIRDLSRKTAQFTVLTGRRRIGKTSLVFKAYEDEPILYFFVSRSSESELCQEFVEELTSKLQIPILGRVERFRDIFEYVMKLSKTMSFTLLIDEFQDFNRVNVAIFSQIQKIWDLAKAESRLNLIVCGSVYSMMTKLFRDHKEPLYGRQTEFIKLEPFTPSVLKQILAAYNKESITEDILALYAFTGGVAKYVELLMDYGATNKEEMLRRIISRNSYFIDEGKNMLIEEFGKSYGRYFDILKLIATGHTSRGDMEGILHAELSGYLTRLESDYGLITKNRPMFQKAANKNIRYGICDPFLRFWFRFVYKYNSYIEANAFSKLQEIVERYYPTYSGKVLESYFKASMIERGIYTHIDSWWDRKGENEIDIIAADDNTQTVTFCEVKRQRKEFDLILLKEKTKRFLEVTGKYSKYKVSCIGLSMEDM